MVADFRTQKVDLNKVSKAVKNFVNNVAKTEGSKKKIDTEKEFNLLGQYLSGNGFTMNNDEIGYIQGFMFEYQEKKTQEFEENNVTDNTKKEVSKIAKRMGNKKKIDTDEEAQALATMLRNSHNELNSADLAYVQNLLITSGYANYLPKPEQPPVNVVNVTINEFVIEDENKNNEGKTNEKTVNSVQEKNTVTPKRKKYKKYYPPKAPDIQPEPDPIPAPKDKDEKKPEEKPKPTIAESDRAKGFALADRVINELNSHVASNSVIDDALSKVNSKNAYSFIGKFIHESDGGLNEGVFSVTDLFNRLTYSDTARVMNVLLKQARDMNIGIEKSAGYKQLYDEWKYAQRLISENPDADPTKETIKRADRAIESLYKEMSKFYDAK